MTANIWMWKWKDHCRWGFFFFASKFTKKIESIDCAFKKQFEKEKMTGDEVIFLPLNLQKKLIRFDDHRWSGKKLKI